MFWAKTRSFNGQTNIYGLYWGHLVALWREKKASMCLGCLVMRYEINYGFLPRKYQV